MRGRKVSKGSSVLAVVVLTSMVWALPQAPANADLGEWSTHGPPGGLRALALDPSDPDVIYAGADGAYKSTNAGGRWNTSSDGLPPNPSVTDLAIDPAQPATLYAIIRVDEIGEAGGIYKTIDGSTTWSSLNPNTSIISLAIDPTNTQVLYAGGGESCYGCDDILYKSTDSGDTWSEMDAGIDSAYVFAIAVDPSNGDIVYAGTQYGIYKSTDGGVSWRRRSRGMGEDGNIRTITIDPQDPSNVYTGLSAGGEISGGVYKSTDRAANWTEMNEGLADQNVVSFAIDPQDTQTVYAGVGTNLYGVFKSTDGAQTWVQAGEGLPLSEQIYSVVFALAVDPRDPQTLYAATTLGGGGFKSTDGAARWFPIRNGLSGACVYAAADPTQPMTVYAGDAFHLGVFSSTDGGSHWRPRNRGIDLLNAEFETPPVIDPVNQGTVYVAGRTGIPSVGVLKTTDGGGSWSPANQGLDSTAVSGLAMAPSNPSVLYAGASGVVYWTEDGAGTWTPTRLDVENTVAALAVDPTDPDHVYAGSWKAFGAGAIYQTVDGGARWRVSYTAPDEFYVSEVAIDPSRPQVLYAALNEQASHRAFVIRSNDSGTTWHNASSGLDGKFLYALAVDPADPSTVYAGGDGGAFVSHDTARTWTAMSEGLIVTKVRSLWIDPTGTRLYAGTCGGGVYDFEVTG